MPEMTDDKMPKNLPGWAQERWHECNARKDEAPIYGEMLEVLCALAGALAERDAAIREVGSVAREFGLLQADALAENEEHLTARAALVMENTSWEGTCARLTKENDRLRYCWKVWKDEIIAMLKHYGLEDVARRYQEDKHPIWQATNHLIPLTAEWKAELDRLRGVVTLPAYARRRGWELSQRLVGVEVALAEIRETIRRLIEDHEGGYDALASHEWEELERLVGGKADAG